MTLSSFLEKVGSGRENDYLQGGIVFVSLDRTIDHLIRRGLSLGPFHPGTPSPWSHCFLIAEAYHGPETHILDCTIRNKDGSLVWDEDRNILDTVTIVCKGLAGKAGGIYDGKVSDYDDSRILTRGVKIVGSLSAQERAHLIRTARALQQQGFRYDFPGLLRGFMRLLTGIKMPGSARLLFCSAFVQNVYLASIGEPGRFAPAVLSQDITPDEIWYSSTGLNFTDKQGDPLTATRVPQNHTNQQTP
jgi:hypothetical protein